MRNQITCVVAVLCVWASLASAQHDGGYKTLWMKPGLSLSHDTGHWVDVDSLATAGGPGLESPWTTFRNVLGAGWKVTHDAAFGRPHWLIGSYDSGISNLSASDATELTERIFAKVAEPLGITEPRQLRKWFGETTRNHHGQEIFGVDYIQTHRGYDVRTLRKPLRARARWNLTLGKLSVLGSEFVGGLNVDVTNPMSRHDAIRLAQSYIPKYAPGTGRVAKFETFVLVGSREGTTFAHLAHAISIATDEPHEWVIYLDAKTGERLYIGDHICHVDVVGNVSIGTMTGAGGLPPAVPFGIHPARDLLVRVVGGNQSYTDASGNFTVPHNGTANVTIQGRYDGRWVNVINDNGPNTSFSQAATPGTAANVVMNGTHANQFNTAEATVYFWTTYTRHMVANEWTSWNGLARLRADVNENNSCNAFYSNNSIHFFTSGRGCNNTAIPDVCGHEYGHAFHVSFFGSINNGQFSEGIGDHLGLFVRTQWDGATFRNLGDGFFTTGGSIRDYRQGGNANNTQWPSANKPVHTGGQIWAGAMMDLVDYLIAKHTFNTGFGIAKNITLAQYSRRPSDMPPGITETMVQDDNDADLRNGTPNFAEIARAADRHGIPRPPDPDPVQFAHTPLAGSGDVVNDYPVSATITGLLAPIASASLTYRIDNNAPVTIPMTSNGNVYTANIPAQSVLTTIAYSIRATDTQNNTERLPASGDFVFTIGRFVTLLADDFESDLGWGPDPGDNAQRGRFERADPHKAIQGEQTLVSQPEDDTTPTGTMCYVTQNGARGQIANGHDVDNGRTSMVSPRLDWSQVPAGTAKMSFNYWLVMHTNQDDLLRLEVSTNDGASWSPVWQIGTSVQAWRSQTVTIPGSYSNQTRIRFWTEDNGENSVLDALIDDVKITTTDDHVAALTANTRTPAIGTTLNYALAAPRDPNEVWAFAISFTAGPTTVPGIGELALGGAIFPFAFGTTDGSGNDTFGLPIPNLPSLRGFDVYTQAVVASPLYTISNLWQIKIQ